MRKRNEIFPKQIGGNVEEFLFFFFFSFCESGTNQNFEHLHVMKEQKFV